MSFRKFNSIENSYRNKTVDKIKELGYATSKDIWVVTEKVHGANFQVATDGTKVWFSSRNGILADGDNFYGYGAIKQDLYDKVKFLHQDITTVASPDDFNIRIYGELFGGGYNHPDVKKLPRKKVQDGIQYTPDVDFYAFAIFVEELNQVEDYLDWNSAYALLSPYFFTAQPLFMGTLDECLKYNNEYQTTLPALLGYPMIEDNICEGNVIEPVIPRWYPSGSRVILKNKNDRFAESSKKGKTYEPIEITELGEYLLKEGLTYVNENRYNAVMSKIGEIDYADTKNIGKLIGLLIKDTMQDFSGDYESIKSLEKRERGKIQKDITTAVRTLVLEKF